MATQSLYRRYRPRRFGEVKGQDHVVRALRNAVAEGREGQAYLFSGPRGTGKTTSARILAKVLNCENPVDGEPCCECDSCLAVERGTSFDVHELDAASNNGVDAMRDLIEKASLGTPGRHKVYILDEVHMLSKAAEAALLKTLEEPPSHVVFVLATTDPQKMSDTIRSRTQHLQFHLLAADTLQEHVRWVADDAGLDVSDESIGQVVARGGGSPRDTLSALELVANSGGDGAETVPVGELIEAMIDQDPGRGLTMVGHAISLGRDPRTLTDDLIAHLRNGFLSLMAPELVQLPASDVDAVAEQARRLGPPGLVRGIEVLGAALGEMRHGPDPRVLLDVAVVQLTSPSVSTDVAGLAARLDRLEQQAARASGGDDRPARRPASGADADARTSTATADGSSGPPRDPSTGTADGSSGPPRDPSTGRSKVGGRAKRAADAPASSSTEPSSDRGAPPADHAPSTTEPAATAVETAPESGAQSQPADSPAADSPADVTGEAWEQTVVPGLRGMARAVYAPAVFVGSSPGSLTLALPNDVHRVKCEQHRAAVEAALAALTGGPVVIELLVRTAGGGADTAQGGPSGNSPPQAEAEADIDLDELVDAPPETVKTPIDRLAEAFPGSELVDERD
jgi:DNA polymerase-3 subunit gamma/tau